MKTNPLVSIIIPVYNVEKYINRCICSLTAQTYKHIEIICVDDCSQDNTLSILTKLVSEDSRIILHKSDKNYGSGASRDIGLFIAQGEYICFCDSDDYIEPNFVEEYLSAFKDFNGEIVMGGYIRNENNHQVIHKLKTSELTPWIYPSVCCRMYKNSFFVRTDVSFQNLTYYDDVLYNIRCLLHNPITRVIQYCGYHYCLNPQSITRKHLGTFLFKKIIDSYYDLEPEIKTLSSQNKMYQMLQYEICQTVTIEMLRNIRHSGIRNAAWFIDERKKLLNSLVPLYTKNFYIELQHSDVQEFKIRIVLFLYIMFEKFKIEKPVLYLLSI